MTLQTRLSVILFVLLFVLAGGASLVLREELSRGANAQGQQLKDLSERLISEESQDRASLLARSLRSLVQAELGEVAARAEATAANPLLAEALSSRQPDAIRRVEEMLASTAGTLRFHRLLDARGSVLLSSAASGVPTRGYSLLDPPSVATSAPLQSLMQAVLEGRSLATVEAFSIDMLQFLTLESPRAEREDKPVTVGSTVLLLLALHPVRTAEGQVVGAIASGLDLTADPRLFAHWQTLHGSTGMSLALLNGTQRVRVEGPTFQAGSRVEEDTLKGFQEKELLIAPFDSGHVARLALRSQSGQAVGALEVHVPAPVLAAFSGEMARVDVEHQQRLFQHGVGLIGMLSVVVLALGILMSRSLATPLRRLGRKAQLASTGELDINFKESFSNDEVGELARSFDRMRISLKKLLARELRSLPAESSPEASRDASPP